METLRGLFSTWADALVQQQASKNSPQQEPPDPHQQPDADGYEPQR